MSCGYRIKTKRKELKLTQTDLADKVNLAFSTISKYEKDEITIPSDNLNAIANVLGVSVDYLLGNTTLDNPKEYLENTLSEFSLSKQEYDNLLKNVLEGNTFDLSTLEKDDNFSKAYSEVFNVYMNYLEANPLDNNIDDMDTIKDLIKPIDDKFKEMLKTLDKDKIIYKETNNGSHKILVYGLIPAGIPIECIEDIIDTEEIPIDMLRGGKEFFGLRVKGDSMQPDYLDGDTLIIQRQDDCESGDDCIVMVNGYDGTFKRVIKNNDKRNYSSPFK